MDELSCPWCKSTNVEIGENEFCCCDCGETTSMEYVKWWNGEMNEETSDYPS